MRNIIRGVSLAALVATASVSAANAEAFKGFYVGGQAGWQHNKLRQNSDLKLRTGNNTFLWGAHAGMSTVSSNGIFMAGEFTADFSTGNHNTTFTPGLFAKLGYRFTPQFVLAGKAGVVYNRYVVRDAFGGEAHKRRFGFAPGVEALYAVKENHIVGLSYTYTHHNFVHVGGIKFKPTSHAVAVKYSYKF